MNKVGIVILALILYIWLQYYVSAANHCSVFNSDSSCSSDELPGLLTRLTKH